MADCIGVKYIRGQLCWNHGQRAIQEQALTKITEAAGIGHPSSSTSGNSRLADPGMPQKAHLNSVGSSSSVYSLSEKYTLLILQFACICIRSVSM